MADKFRMVVWLVLAVIFYTLALTLFGDQPQLQTLSWKLGNLTIASFVGYWIDRNAFGGALRINAESPPLQQVRRAIIIAAAMITVGLGL